MSQPAYMKRYLIRLTLFMASYCLTLFGGLTFARNNPPGTTTAVVLALLTAAPICGVFWAIFRLIAECDDEYQRLLFVKQVLWATAITLATATIWQFLNVYDAVDSGPQWIGVIWFAMLGVGGCIARWRA